MSGVPFIQPGMHYGRAPITEAVIDIRCDLPPEATLDVLRQGVDVDIYPDVQNYYEISGVVDISESGVRGDAHSQQIGYLFRDETKERAIVQSRSNGFAFSALPPYGDWDAFSSEALLAWGRYRDAVRPLRITRLGVRFINRIEIPKDRVEIKDYLRTAIDVSPYLPQMINSYFLQVQVPIPHYAASATVTSSLLNPEKGEATALLLDIDAWRATSIALGEPQSRDEEVSEQLQSLRLAKNYVFEACITDATRGLIK